jgi:DNA polymerase III delta prime subunit
MGFVKAVKHGAKLRMSIEGPSGSGKTFTALKVARALVGPQGRIAVLDSENGSASKYADAFEFDTDPTFKAPYHPDKYTAAVKDAEAAGYDCLIVDSLSHAWSGPGGLLEAKDDIAKRKQGNSYVAWADATPIQNRMIQTILDSKLHVIVTMRSKMEYILEEVTRNGKKTQSPRKIGLAPVQRDGVEYEFDVTLAMDLDHCGSIQKTRCTALDGKVYDKPGTEVAEALRLWLDGAPPPAHEVERPRPVDAARLHPGPVDYEDGPPEEPPPADEPEPPTTAQLDRLEGWVLDQRLTEKTRNYLSEQMSRGLTRAAAGALIGRIKTKFATELSEGKAEPGANG